MNNNKYLKQTAQPHRLIFASFALILTLSSCSDNANLTKVCANNVAICSELKEDSWCKRERKNVLITKVKVKNNNLDADKYQLLLGYEHYIKCMSLASQIQHIKLKEKTTLRKDNVIVAKAGLAQLTEETSHSKHPHLLYYQWSRESNEIALSDLLKLEGSNQLENSIAQYHLATYYIKRNSTKTIKLLYRSLELHNPDTELNPEILQSLVTIFTKKKQYKQAYIWLRTYQLLLDKQDDMIEVSLQSYQRAAELDASFLDDVASTTLDKINDGEFSSPKT